MKTAVTTKDRVNFLVIDDKQLILSLIIRMLKHNGYKNFVTAFSAPGGLHKLKKIPVNFIIIDWDMPNMTGIEFLMHVRKNLQLFNIPILIMSENMTENKIYYAMEEGADGFMEKPFSETELIGAINEVLQLQLDPDPIKYQLQKLRSLKLQKKYMEAIEFAQSLLEKDQHIDIVITLAECYLSSKDYSSAEDVLMKSLKKKETYKAFHLLGKVLMAQGKYKESIEFLEKAYLINPMNTEAVIDMGTSYLRMGFTKEAAEAFGSLKDNSLTNLSQTSIASAYLTAGDINKAGRYLKQAQDPILETINVFNKYAIELRKAGRLQDAIEQYKRCLKIDPENHIIMLNFAGAYIELQNYAEAKELLEKCLEIDPNYETTRKLLNFVTSKESD